MKIKDKTKLTKSDLATIRFKERRNKRKQKKKGKIQKKIPFEIKISPGYRRLHGKEHFNSHEYANEQKRKKNEAFERKQHMICVISEKLKKWCKDNPDKVKIRLEIARSRKKYRGTKIENIVIKHLNQKYLDQKNIEIISQCFGIIGTPDIVIINNKNAKAIVIFIDGCFWHGCKNCIDWYDSKRIKYDIYLKMVDQKEYDRLITKELQEMGLVVIRLWEHDIHSGKYKRILNHIIRSNV